MLLVGTIGGWNYFLDWMSYRYDWFARFAEPQGFAAWEALPPRFPRDHPYRRPARESILSFQIWSQPNVGSPSATLQEIEILSRTPDGCKPLV